MPITGIPENRSGVSSHGPVVVAGDGGGGDGGGGGEGDGGDGAAAAAGGGAGSSPTAVVLTVAVAGKAVGRYGWAMPRYACGCLGRC